MAPSTSAWPLCIVHGRKSTHFRRESSPLLAQVVVAFARLENSALAAAEANTLIIGYFYLLRLGEYLGGPDPILDDFFRFRNLAMWVGARAIASLTCPTIADRRAATFATLTFTRQKNGIRGEKVGHGRSGHPQICPVLCLVERVRALRSISVPPSTPLNAFGPSTPGGPLRYIITRKLTVRLRTALLIYPDPSYSPFDVSARSTRVDGAMALLCAGVDRDRIRMIGRWRSDEMFRYLHLQAQPLMTGVSAAMLHGGTFQLAPG